MLFLFLDCSISFSKILGTLTNVSCEPILKVQCIEFRVKSTNENHISSYWTTEIQKLSIGEWRHCHCIQNLVDVLSRGITVKNPLESKVWLHRYMDPIG